MNSILNCIDTLEKKLLEELQLSNSTLSEAAMKQLTSCEILLNISEEDVLLACLEANLPSQYYRENQFGYFNVTLKKNNLFNIQIYIMNDIDTEIHNHSFTGAFMLLTGHTVEKSFSFKKELKIEDSLYKGSVIAENSKVFKPGTIGKLDKTTIHQLIRINKLNITLIITANDKQNQKINGYFLPPNLYLENKNLPANFHRKIAALQMLCAKKISSAASKLNSFISSCSYYELLTLVTRLNKYHFNSTYTDTFKVKIVDAAKTELKRRNLDTDLILYLKFITSSSNKFKVLK